MTVEISSFISKMARKPEVTKYDRAGHKIKKQPINARTNETGTETFAFLLFLANKKQYVLKVIRLKLTKVFVTANI
jgi:hypothetical protein